MSEAAASDRRLARWPTFGRMVACHAYRMNAQRDVQSTPKAPGDEVRPGTPQAGEAVCPLCSGEGRVEGKACPNCNGTGMITQLVGDA